MMHQNLIFFIIFIINLFPTCLTCRCNPFEQAHVCASNGKTYNNTCLFSCATKSASGIPTQHITIIQHKECSLRGGGALPCNCPEYYAPACATDHETWPNECLLNCGEKTLAHKGQCGYPPCSCSDDDYSLVCGSDGLTYKNKCVLDCEKRTTYGRYWKLKQVKLGACMHLQLLKSESNQFLA